MLSGKEGLMCQRSESMRGNTGGYLVCKVEPGRLAILYPVPS